MAIIKLSKSEQRRLSVFFTCLALAFVAWVFTILSSDYSYTAQTVITFVNPPVKRSFRALQSDTVEAKVKGNGWNLLFARMDMQHDNISVNLKNLDTKNFVVLSSQLKTINESREANKEIAGFSPDTLYFDFSSRAVKRVPVVLQYKLGLERQFIVSV